MTLRQQQRATRGSTVGVHAQARGGGKERLSNEGREGSCALAVPVMFNSYLWQARMIARLL